jgi:hypothetical protein
MEFKGTKGKWEVSKNSSTLSTIDKKDFITCWVFPAEKEEAHANALLISKAPEMLEMLQIYLADLNNIIPSDAQRNKIQDVEQLIKESTEL